MRLVQFCLKGDEGRVRVGVEQGEGLGVVDLKAFDPSMPTTMKELLELGEKGMECAQRALEASPAQCVVPRVEVRLLSPVLAPEKVVAGFTVANDVSARDWQMKRNGKQWLLGKTFDSFCPLGPALVTTSAVKAGNSVTSRTPTQPYWTRFMTLSPGDVFPTGTPPGVGVFRNPPVFLKRRDVVEGQIDQLGVIRNNVV
ncbi:hypothetical protein J4Q44_G00231470 [Coregonus suidteri]|uniref:Fumarylacetoacetase-like C-terminal domain-containing protein n=1 Tax=Coregonus suidteri TaxID=861788 RepID=A0AAN8LDC0_9TELE